MDINQHECWKYMLLPSLGIGFHTNDEDIVALIIAVFDRIIDLIKYIPIVAVMNIPMVMTICILITSPARNASDADNNIPIIGMKHPNDDNSMYVHHSCCWQTRVMRTCATSSLVCCVRADQATARHCHRNMDRPAAFWPCKMRAAQWRARVSALSKRKSVSQRVAIASAPE